MIIIDIATRHRSNFRLSLFFFFLYSRVNISLIRFLSLPIPSYTFIVVNYRIKCDFLLSIIPPSKIKELFLSNQVCCCFTFTLLITLSKEQSFFYKKRKTKLSILKIIRHISNPPLNLYEKFSYKKLISFE